MRKNKGYKHEERENNTYIAFQNIQGGKCNVIKWTEMLQYCEMDKIVFMGVIETNLKIDEDIPIKSWADEQGWKWHNGNVANEARGGIGILWKEGTIKVDILQTDDNVIWARVMVKNSISFIVGLVYLKPGTKYINRNIEIIEKISEFVASYPNDKIIIMGDFNAHIQELDKKENSNGYLMRKFMDSANMIIGNCTSKYSGGSTWHNNIKETCIDWVIYDHKTAHLIIKITNDSDGIRSLGADHNRQKIEICNGYEKDNKQRGVLKKRTTNKIKWDINEDSTNNFMKKVKTLINQQKGQTHKINEILGEAAKDTLTPRADKQEYRTKSWWDEEIYRNVRIRKRLCAEHRTAKKRGLEKSIIDKKWEEYRHQKLKLIDMKRKKIAVMNQILFKNVMAEGGNNKGKVWKYIQRISSSDKSKGRKNKTEAKVSREWINKFMNLMKNKQTSELVEGRAEREITQLTEKPQQVRVMDAEDKILECEEGIHIKQREIDKAIKSLKNNKTQGDDSLSAEVYKLLDKDLMDILAEEFEEIIEDKIYEQHMKAIDVKLIELKKGKLRPISIMGTERKIFSIIIKNRLVDWMSKNGKFHKLQFGGVKDRQITDAVYIVTETIHIAKALKRNIIIVFLDFKDAFMKVNREKLWKIMEDEKFPKELLETIKELYKNICCKLVCGDCCSEEFSELLGLLQGCPLSAVLFNIYLLPLARRLTKMEKGFKLKQHRIMVLEETTKRQEKGYVINNILGAFYQDDIAIIAETKRDMNTMLKECDEYASEYNLELNMSKTQAMVWNNRNETQGNSELDIEEGKLICNRDKEIILVNKYKYLGVTINNNEEDIFKEHKDMISKKCEKLANMTIAKGRNTYNKFFFIRTIWKGMMVPVITYANQIICRKASAMKDLEDKQLLVARHALGANAIASDAAVFGEFGTSSFGSRGALAKIMFLDRLNLMEKGLFPQIVFTYVNTHNIQTPLTKEFLRINKRYKWFPTKSYRVQGRDELIKLNRKVINEAESERWYKEINKRKGLREIYAKGKKLLGKEINYDGSLESQLIFKARTDALATNTRCRRFAAGSVECSLCKKAPETVPHIILFCEKLPNSIVGNEGIDGKEELLTRLGFRSEEPHKLSIAKQRLMLWHCAKFRGDSNRIRQKS